MNSAFTKIIILYVVLACIPRAAIGQRGIFLTGGVEIGGTGRDYRFRQEGNKLAKEWKLYPDSDLVEFTINPEITIHYHFWEHWGVSLGMKLTEKIISVHDKQFMSDNQITGT